MKMTIEQYLQRQGWEGVERGGALIGRCPIHPEEHASFAVYPDSQFCIDFHDGETYDVAGLWHAIEGGEWEEIFRQVKEYNGDIQEPFLPRPLIHERKEATSEQRAVLTAAMHWFHEQLWSDPMRRGRDYFKYRGTDIDPLRYCCQLGYAPAAWTASEENYWFASFGERMQQAVGDDWKQVAASVGFIARSGKLLLRDRVIFCCINAMEECVYFQARQVQFDEEKRALPYLGGYTPKVPFTLDVACLPTFQSHVESPFGVIALAPFALPAIAWLGAPGKMDYAWMQRTLTRAVHIIATDNDTVRYDNAGGAFYPGESHAEKIGKALTLYGRAWLRVMPPLQYKDLDKWISIRGIHPYLTTVQQMLAQTYNI